MTAEYKCDFCDRVFEFSGDCFLGQMPIATSKVKGRVSDCLVKVDHSMVQSCPECAKEKHLFD